MSSTAARAASTASLEQRLMQLATRWDAIEAGLRHVRRQLQPVAATAARTATTAPSTAALDGAGTCAAVTTSCTDVAAVQPDPREPAEVLQLRRHCSDSGLRSAEFIWVASNYYAESLQWRRDALLAPSIRHLCKTIVMENTHCTNSDCSDPRNSRFYLVVYQYVDRFNSDMVARAIHALNPGRGKKKFNFRFADPAEALRLTGVGSGAVAPFGTHVPVPVILSAGVTQLAPPVFYVGGGHLHCKCRLDTEEFIRVSGALVAPVTVPLTEEELQQITD
ncbi:Aminoacyl-tRNA editing domain containing protein [Novymonas esmeraldas]|uniref:Aminoacyl-tRNA editing domain containing protein n=1 Tax=Novymonas esmeraldas TaxID=1808958 RepID=A0AAW0F4F7_9TRYP